MKVTVDTLKGKISIDDTLGTVVNCNIEFLHGLLTLPAGTVIQSMGLTESGNPAFKSFVMPNLDIKRSERRVYCPGCFHVWKDDEKPPCPECGWSPPEKK